MHNTYFTLPVLFTMISNHYAGLYGHAWNWVLLLMISLAGALIRVWFVQRHKGKPTRWCSPSGLVVLGADGDRLAAAADRRHRRRRPPSRKCNRSFQARCQPCHAAKPTQEGFAAPPKGVILETRGARSAPAPPMINQQAGVTRAMPPGNMTNITEDERRLIARWVKGGAQ